MPRHPDSIRRPSVRPRHLLAVLVPPVLLALLAIAPVARAADTDGDGVDDAFDNCTEAVNSDQRDTNGDGLGNRCDADLDGDGLVAASDFFRSFAPCLGTTVAEEPSCADADLDGDGVVTAADFFSVMRPSLGGRPGPGEPDADGDGMQNVDDHCPRSPMGAFVDALGCSVGDLAQDPDASVRPVHAAISELLEQIDDTDDSLADLRLVLSESLPRIALAVDSLGRGDFCPARNPLSEAALELFVARRDLLTRVNELETGSPPKVPPGESADVHEAETEAVALATRIADLDGVSSRLSQLRNSVENACKNSSETDSVVRGRIAEIDPAARRIVLEDPTGGQQPQTLILSKEFLEETPLYPGRDMVAVGTKLSDGGFVAATGEGIGIQEAIDLTLTYLQCVFPRIAPVQPALSQFNYSGPVDLHDPEAYRSAVTGRLLLERGMGLGVAGSCPAPGLPKFVRHSLRLVLDYTSASGTPKTTTLATDLQAGQVVSFPSDIDAGVGSDNHQLTIFYRHQSCLFTGFGTPPSCSEVVEKPAGSYTLSFLSAGGYCLASYDDTVFDLEDDDQTSFERTRVSSKFVFASPDPGTQMTFVARGYRSDSTSQSTYPSVVDVYEGQSFAVYNHDFHTDPNVLFPSATYGTSSASALAWPRVVGVRNSAFFSYSCRLPHLVRDRLNSCNAPDSYYRLPFYPGYPVWYLSQGNNGSFTHNGKQRYAFDFVSPSNTPIRAARGGTVVFVREDQTGNSFYNPSCSNCNANAAVVRHQDGSQSAYFHFPTNGVFVSQGQKIKRGHVIGKVGNTGYSTDPHLHFQAQVAASGGQTLRSRFQTSNHSCWIPPSDTSDLISNNN